jgi:DHA1 family multidrug resistance protein-like MFS transporter
LLLLLGGLLVVFGARERFVRPTAEALGKTGRISIIFTYPGFITMLALFFLFNFASHFAMPIFPLFIETITHVKSQIAGTTGMLLAVSGATAALSAGAVGYFVDGKDYKKVLIVSLLLTSVTVILHGMAESIKQMLIIRICYGLCAGGIIPAMNAIVARIIPQQSFGKAYGFTSSMTCLGMAMGPLTGGVFAAHLGYRLPFILIGALLIFAVFPVASKVRYDRS